MEIKKSSKERNGLTSCFSLSGFIAAFEDSTMMLHKRIRMKIPNFFFSFLNENVICTGAVFIVKYETHTIAIVILNKENPWFIKGLSFLLVNKNH